MADGPQIVRIGERRLRVTNLDKVVYPETGTTKGEIIDYYARIAPVLLPVVAGRPVTRKRWVEGVVPVPAGPISTLTRDSDSSLSAVFSRRAALRPRRPWRLLISDGRRATIANRLALPVASL